MRSAATLGGMHSPLVHRPPPAEERILLDQIGIYEFGKARGAPGVDEKPLHALHVFPASTGRIVGFGKGTRLGVYENQAGRTRRVAGGEENRGRTSVSHAAKNRPLRPDRVQHAARFVGPSFVERKVLPRGRIGRSSSSPIERDNPGPGTQPAKELGIGWPFPAQVDAVGRARNPEHVKVAIAEHLVGNAVITENGEESLGPFAHCRQSCRLEPSMFAIERHEPEARGTRTSVSAAISPALDHERCLW